MSDLPLFWNPMITILSRWYLPPFESLEGLLVIAQPVLGPSRLQVAQQEIQQEGLPLPEGSWKKSTKIIWIKNNYKITTANTSTVSSCSLCLGEKFKRAFLNCFRWEKLGYPVTVLGLTKYPALIVFEQTEIRQNPTPPPLPTCYGYDGNGLVSYVLLV